MADICGEEQGLKLMISALITVFHPTLQVADNVEAISRQVDAVYVCDNSPESNSDLFPGEKIRYVWFGENLGISRAYNRVLKDTAFGWKDSDRVIFFDQDSRIEDGHIAVLCHTWHKLDLAGYSVGCLGPAYFNTSSGTVEIPRQKRPLGAKTYGVSSIITSSMLCRYGDLQKIGFWNEDVFLDMADWDLCWRLAENGMLCCLTEQVVLHHTLGVGEKKIGPLRLRVGEPYREYYQLRECLYLLGKSYTPLKYRIRFLAMVLVRSPLHLIFLDHRKQRFRYITKGVADFFRGRRGALK